MSNDKPYLKREIDEKFDRLHDKMDLLLDSIQQSRDERHAFEKNAELIFKTVSQNSGEITQLWEAQEKLNTQGEANAKATKLIDEITTTWKVGKAVVSFVIGLLLFIVAIKTIIHGGLKDGLLQLKNLIF